MSATEKMFNMYFKESFSYQETSVLNRFFTNVEKPVFAIKNLPDVVKGALFARYSRSPMSLRRLFLEEFYKKSDVGVTLIANSNDNADSTIGINRAEKLYERIFTEYGDDSVARLGGVHLACEQASNLLTKELEWGRLSSYLEQSTRYIYYDIRLGQRYRYHVPKEVSESHLAHRFTSDLDVLFDNYSNIVHQAAKYFQNIYPKQKDDSSLVWRSTIRAKACDIARGLLPASTLSNVGIFASGQAYEAMLIRMRIHPLAEVRVYADTMLQELRKVIPSFMRRVDMPSRGGLWSSYLEDTRLRVDQIAKTINVDPILVDEVDLIEWDPNTEEKLVAAILFPEMNLPESQLIEIVQKMSFEQKTKTILSYVGDRKNRRHKPGRALEKFFYRFEILSDFGSFRDLQRHRMLTIEWQRLTTRHGYLMPPEIKELGFKNTWDEMMGKMSELFDVLERDLSPEIAQYVVPFGYKMRYFLHLNVREAFHLLELRTAQQGHSDYRRICQQMHKLIKEKAGHNLIADAMKFVDYSQYKLERLESERRANQKRESSS